MKIPRKQKGLALLMLVFLMALAITFYSLKSLDSSEIQNQRNKKTAAALAEAKSALIGSVTGVINIANPAYLPNPDLKLGATVEGRQALSSGAVDISLIGKFPWRDLGASPLRDGWNECLWYAVSGRYKNSPSTAAFNWDTQGQISVIDGNGNLIRSNLAALIISPGSLLSAQNRQTVAIDTPQCGGNYDVRNYLDAYNSVNAIAGEVNYFVGSANNRQAPNTNDKVFVLDQNDFYNDQFVFVTMDEVFETLIKRNDFKMLIDNATSDPAFHSYLISKGVSINKGTNNIICSELGVYEVFCNNWVEMFLFTELSPPATVTIDGMTTTVCTHVLLFGGKKTAAQDRSNAVNKSIPSNYIEGTNVAAFNVPTANSNDFEGFSTFDPENPDRDILKCI